MSKQLPILAFLYILLIYPLYAQNKPDNFDVASIDNSIDLFNEILAAIENIPKGNEYSIIDSLVNLRKSSSDLMFEEGTFEGSANPIGNDLTLRVHQINDFEISYIKNSSDNTLYMLRFRYYFDKEYSPSPDFDNKMKLKSNFYLTDFSDKYRYSYMMNRGYEGKVIFKNEFDKYKNDHPDVLFEINAYGNNRDKINFLNDPLSILTYGVACSFAGMPPEALDIFAFLVHNKEYRLLERLAFSPNPATRLYAADALEYLSNRGEYDIPNEISDKISTIKKEDAVIEKCEGCYFGTATIKECVEIFSESRKNPYRNFMFIKESRDGYK